MLPIKKDINVITIKSNKLAFMVLSVLVTGVLLMPAVAMGERNTRVEAETNTTETETTSKPEVETETSHTENSSSGDKEKSEASEKKLTSVKLKVCQNREKTINKIMERISTRGQKQLDLFNGIAQKTEDFYVKKGISLSNYDALVSAVNTKKSAAQATVDEVKAKVADFKCDGTDPKGVASSFKQALKDEIAALKAYKTAVKNLIVGVKSAQSTSSSTETTTEGN